MDEAGMWSGTDSVCAASGLSDGGRYDRLGRRV